ncbi:YjbF family lipoprotein [Stenotrophomonas sp. YIM B06876]|uniref:YjbF family lipoprotein n=1 Tax=Stenotrophomonas sp. YIM B06876 TaxID=3060211 RepID=UPI002738E2CA|nr:YjbF family lipoprotein [Stenotrophomonas sp. YIM B06876]
MQHAPVHEVGLGLSDRAAWSRAFGYACLVFAALLMTGCSTLTRSSFDQVRLAIADRRAHAVSADQVAALRYAQIAVEGMERPVVMVLGNVDDGRQAWYSGDRRIVFLRNGLLTGTAGMPGGDAAGITVDNPAVFDDLREVGDGTRVQRSYDWMPGYRYGVQVRGDMRRGPMVQVEILGQNRTLLRIDERLSGPGVDALNNYYVDPQDGAIVKSRQLVRPGKSLEFTVLKPYREGGQ